jgi:hypothetical protein
LPVFKIEKCYFDCIDNQGNCFIIYWARIDIFLLRLVYSAVIFNDSEGYTKENSYLGKISRPLISKTISYSNEFLKTELTFERRDPPIKLSLYKKNNTNELIWDCHHPKAFAEISFNGKIYKGLGYAETLSSDINPASLPIDELRWGRFLSDTYSIIWICWKGSYPLTKLFLNGILYEDALFEPGNIIFGEGRYSLGFSEIRTVRAGSLEGIFSKMRFLKVLFSRRLLDTIEKKYKAKSMLCFNSDIISNGWSLYEVVTWGK